MAYRKKGKSRGKVSRRNTSSTYNRRAPARRRASSRNRSAGGRQQTLRIVVEQSGPSDPVQQMTNHLTAPSTPRKARF